MKKEKGENQFLLLGWAADGFPIYGPYGYIDPKDPSKGVNSMKASYVLKKGNRPGSADPKDKRRAKEVTPDSEEPGGSYDGISNEDFE